MNKKRSTIILIGMIILTIIFIFSNSLYDGTSSTKQSETVRKAVEPFLTPMIGTGKVTSYLIRKLAHFAEFALLGLELGFLWRRFSISMFFIAVMTALSDETIQMFSDRSSQVQDIWLDFAGACTGMIVSVGICYIWKKRKK